MANHLLFFVDRPAQSRPYDWSWIDKWCALFDVEPVAIDVNSYYETKPYPPFCFHTLDEAMEHEHFAGHTFIWLDPNATEYLDEVSVPIDDVVYCIGDDREGFGSHALEGQRVRLRAPHPGWGDEWYAAICATLLLFEVCLP